MIPIPPLNEAYINSLRGTVIPRVVRVVLEIHFPNGLEGSGIIDVADSTVVVCNDQTVQLRDINDTLWRTETADGVNALTCAQIEHLDSIVAKRANK
jgi:hypothetical protein